MSRCEFSDLPVEQCAHCTGRSGMGKPAEAEIQARWTAYYDGQCDWCGGRIHEGENIGRDHLGGYVCERCLR